MAVRRSGRFAAALSGVLATVLLILTPLAAGNSFTPPYNAVSSNGYPSASGPSGSNSWSIFPPSVGNGTLYYWHVSTAGQAGPSSARFEAYQGFGTPTSVITKGSHTVSLTWKFSGKEYLSVSCYGGTGAGTAYAEEDVEFNLWNTVTNSWLLSSNPVINAWVYSLSCPSSGTYAHTLSGSPTFPFSAFAVPSGSYEVWGFLDTITSVSETSVNDMNGTACIDYTLTASSCWGTGTGTGYAQLTNVVIN